jgi:hypothetical protein
MKHFARPISVSQPHRNRGAFAAIPERPLSRVMFAKPDDLPDLLRFLRLMHNEIEDGQVDEDTLSDVAEDLSKSKGGWALIIRGRQLGTEGVEASMGIHFYRPPLAQRYRLICIWNLVAPPVRDTGHAKSLLIAARALADTLHCPLWAVEPGDAHIGEVLKHSNQMIGTSRNRLFSRHLSQTAVVFVHKPAAVG